MAQELANAINSNSSEQIRELKSKYANSKEFLKAKKFLDDKCKQTWNVFSSNPFKLPKEAMKTLGITNQPSLDFLLGDSLRYFEKSGGDMTVKIIKNILNNKNLNYTTEDLHKFIQTLCKNQAIKLNKNTIYYLITEQKYDKQKLHELGIDEKQALNGINLTEKIKYYSRRFANRYLQQA